MRYIVTESQLNILIEQDTGFTMRLDRAHSTLKGSEKINKDFKSLDAHTLMTILGIGAIFIPVVGPLISAGIGMADASLYYNQGDKKTAGLVAAFSILPFVGSVVTKIPGVKELGAKGMAALASKVSKGGKNLTKVEKEILTKFQEYNSQIKLDLGTASKTLGGLNNSIVKFKPEYIKKFGQESYDGLLTNLLSNKINKQQFLSTLQSSGGKVSKISNVAKFGIKFSQQEIEGINSIVKEISRGENVYKQMVFNTKEGRKTIWALLADEQTLKNFFPDVPPNVSGFKTGEGDMIVLVKKYVDRMSPTELKELLFHEAAHVKDPAMRSSKLMKTYLKKGEEMNFKNYLGHKWEVTANLTSSVNNMVSSINYWKRFVPKEQLLGYLDEIINYATGKVPSLSKGAIKLIGDDGIGQYSKLYGAGDTKSAAKFLSKIVQQATSLKKEVSLSL